MLSFSITVPVLKILQYNENAASLRCSLKETAIICCYTAIVSKRLLSFTASLCYCLKQTAATLCYHRLLLNSANVSNSILSL